MEASLYQTFRDFLRENECEAQFQQAFQHQSPNLGYMDRFIAEELLVIDETFVNRCFNWELTKEGREYWRIIDGKWFQKYMQMK